MTRFEIVRVAEQYIGVQFQLYGRSPIFGLDCWGFFQRICHDLDIPCSQIKKYDNLLRVVLRSLHAMQFKRVQEIRYADLMVSTENGHVGVKTQNGMLHAMKDGIQNTEVIGAWIGFEFPGVV